MANLVDTNVKGKLTIVDSNKNSLAGFDNTGNLEAKNITSTTDTGITAKKLVITTGLNDGNGDNITLNSGNITASGDLNAKRVILTNSETTYPSLTENGDSYTLKAEAVFFYNGLSADNKKIYSDIRKTFASKIEYTTDKSTDKSLSLKNPYNEEISSIKIDTIDLSDLSDSKNYLTKIGSATDQATRSTIVQRDVNGDFSARYITATLDGGLKGTIFGKSINTVGDIAGQAFVYGTYISETDKGNRYTNSGLQIRENNLIGDINTEVEDIGYGPSIGFNWSGKKGCSIQMGTDGYLHFYKQDGASQNKIYADVEGDVKGNSLTASTAAALALTGDVGNTSQPVYFSDGLPKGCTDSFILGGDTTATTGEGKPLTCNGQGFFDYRYFSSTKNKITDASLNLGLTKGSSPTFVSLNLTGDLTLAGTFYVNSDSRLKTIHSSPILGSMLNSVLSTPVYNYSYNYAADTPYLGIMAQDLESSLEENSIDPTLFVSKEDTDELKEKRSLRESKLIYLLWGAVQAQEQELSELKKEIKKLKGE